MNASGNYIYTEINRLDMELREMNKSLNAIEDQVGRGCLAYNVMVKARDEKSKEFNRALTQQWIKA